MAGSIAGHSAAVAVRTVAAHIAASTFAEKHLGSIRKKIAALRALETTVAALVSGCETTCCGSAAPDCVILQPGCGAA